MTTGWYGPCPHCGASLSYLEGVTGSTMSPKCPRCAVLVTVRRATFLMLDHSRPAPRPSPIAAAPAPAVPLPDDAKPRS